MSRVKVEQALQDLDDTTLLNLKNKITAKYILKDSTSETIDHDDNSNANNPNNFENTTPSLSGDHMKNVKKQRIPAKNSSSKSSSDNSNNSNDSKQIITTTAAQDSKRQAKVSIYIYIYIRDIHNWVIRAIRVIRALLYLELEFIQTTQITRITF